MGWSFGEFVLYTGMDVAGEEQGNEHHSDARGVRQYGRTEHEEHDGTGDVRDHHDPATVDPIGEDTGVKTKTRNGIHCSAVASAISWGFRVSDATRSGPAASAIPSPRLVVHDDATNHRSSVPVRRGNTASPI